MWKGSWVGFLILDLLWCCGAEAGRPLATEDAGVAGAKVFQVEIGTDYVREGQDEAYGLLVTPILGLSKRMEFSAEFPLTISRPREVQEGEPNEEEGLSDISLVAKGLIVPEGKTFPALLFKPYVKLANGNESKGLGSGDEDVGLVTVITKGIRNVTMHGNMGYVFVGDAADETLKNYILYSFGLEYGVSRKLRCVGELFIETASHFDPEAFEHHDGISSLVGVTYQLTRKATADTGFRIGMADEKKPEYNVTFGISFTFN